MSSGWAASDTTCVAAAALAVDARPRRPFVQGIFDDDMQVVTGPREYNWTLIDQSWDYQVGLGLTPVVELSFMPVRPFSSSPVVVHIFMSVHLFSFCRPSSRTARGRPHRARSLRAVTP